MSKNVVKIILCVILSVALLLPSVEAIAAEEFSEMDLVEEDFSETEFVELVDNTEENAFTSENIQIVEDIEESTDLAIDVSGDYSEYATGYVPSEIPIPVKHKQLEEGNDSWTFFENLPKSYTTPNLPKVRDQNPYGTCWAFATLGLAETSLLKKGLISDPDLSELHLAWFLNNSVVDPLGGIEDNYSREGMSAINDGGDFEGAFFTLAQWKGAADEEVAQYDRDIDVVSCRGIQDELAYEDIAHLENFYIENVDLDAFRDSKNISMLAPIKNMIYEYGAAGITILVPGIYDMRSDLPRFNVQHNCYYSPESAGSGHAVVILGWDDDFPKEHFAIEAPGDGAFLVRNSWTTSGSSDENSFSGYFWMSYYEASLGSTFYAADFNVASNYENNYQYDGYNASYGGYSIGANVFTAHSLEGYNGEILKAVSFFSDTTNVNYRIKIYKDVVDAPDSGNLVEKAITTGTTGYAGYYTIPLTEAVEISALSKFAVVVELDAPALHKEMESDCTRSNHGESFSYDSCWADMESEGNFRIKAFTDNVKTDDVISVEEIKFSNISDNKVSLGVNEAFKVSTTILPVRATNKKLVWTSSDDDIVKVNNGQLVGITEGNAVITVSTVDGSVENKINVIVEKKLLSININLYECADGSYEYAISYNPYDYVPKSEIKWTYDKDVLSIDSQGRVTEKMLGITTVKAFLDGVTATRKYIVHPSSKTFRYNVEKGNVISFSWERAKNIQDFSLIRNGESILPYNNGDIFEYRDEGLKKSVADEVSYEFIYGDNDILARYSFNVGLGPYNNIIYHLNGGIQNPYNYSKYLSGVSYRLLEPTPPDGMVFEDWYLDEMFSVKVEQISENMTGDIHLYAKYITEDENEWRDVPSELREVFDNSAQNVSKSYWCAVKYEDQYYIFLDGSCNETSIEMPYTGSEACFDSILVFYGKKLLKEQRDYTVSYNNNVQKSWWSSVLEDNPYLRIYFIDDDKVHDITICYSIVQPTLEKAVFSSNLIILNATDGESLSSVKPVLTYYGSILNPDTDYYLRYYEGESEVSPYTVLDQAGKIYTIYANGIGEYIGKTKDYVTVKVISKSEDSEESKDSEQSEKSLSLSTVKIAGLKTSVSYTGSILTLQDLFNSNDKKCKKEHWDAVTLYSYDSKTKVVTPLIEGRDYTVSIGENDSVGKVPVTFIGIGGVTGEIIKTVTIKPLNAAKEFDIEVENTTFTKGGAKPEVTVTYAGKTLIAGTDYTVTYKNNKKAALSTAKSAPYVTVKAKGNYSGTSKKVKFSIAQADVSILEMQVKDVTFKANGKKGYFLVKPTFTEAGKKVTVGKNKDINAAYTYTYAEDTKLKDGTVKKVGEVAEPTDKLSGPTSIKLIADIEAGGAKSSYTGSHTFVYVYRVK
ncbi:lectin like domain-containing protein [Butyrivibrio sp. MC2021]|uniref:lectin like domain-containing protein n=1 Tax=Butyrivibrio sp. MC2021 TaxID=1408306 RepID=UPI00047C3E1F|nr:lectin like domain-containing protein [Butyrivibrio sp. MC2021]